MPTLPGIDLATLFDAVSDSVYLIDPLTSGIVWCNRHYRPNSCRATRMCSLR